ncbi:hypothetical protein B4U79_11238 [Dinothrombium tinctorium]|uniref:S-phase kinase-associated protein 1-like protein n=1 Tax=Dinothrombium tinctorium TaxID=1965070 RepID=A0A443QVZ4_9ACAR|nr:hypothetical protein B4U79_11238 [Dinothrombium tinctorium]
MSSILIESSDGKRFDIKIEIAKSFGAFKTMLDFNIGEENSSNEPITLKEVDSFTLSKIIEWSERHLHDPRTQCDYEKHNHNDEEYEDLEIDAWDENFLKNLTHNQLFEVIKAANFLDLKFLFDVSCEVAAQLIKGKNTEQIRELFGEVNDLTPEEEENIRKEFSWCKR